MPADLSDVRALLSRSHDSGCNLAWNATLVYEGVQGVYVDPCSEARYAFDGTALHAGATRDLHQFRAERVTTGYVVNFEELTLGACREGREGGCSPEGQPERRNVPRQALPAGFGDEYFAKRPVPEFRPKHRLDAL